VKIRSMTASFGRLERARLELSDGLNLIHAPNESGKSTWCAFWKAMLYGIDTRDRDKKGHLADKNRFQPWSGTPMEGELQLEWQGREITIRRGPKGNTPFAAFSAVYTGTEEPVPGLTAQNCGELLTGVGREVFERSAFITGGSLAVTSAPELERRIAALVSSGQEEVSFSQTESRLREWLNRRRVNRSVGLIPRLEEELRQTRQELDDLSALSADITQLEGEHTRLLQELEELEGEAHIHRRLARKELNRRCAQAGEELAAAQAQLAALEAEGAKYGPPPSREQLRQAQGELQYLKVLDDEIKQAAAALTEAEAACEQAQELARDEHFSGMTAEEALARTTEALTRHQAELDLSRKHNRPFLPVLLTGLLLLGLGAAAELAAPAWLPMAGHRYSLIGLFLCTLFAALARSFRRKSMDHQKNAARILEGYGVETAEDLSAAAQDYVRRCQALDEAARHAKTVRTALNDRLARRENTRTALFAFVHSFAPQVTDLFGCSAAVSRALSLEHELVLARERTAERLRRREDLLAQGGQDFDTLELLHPPVRTPEETAQAISHCRLLLEQTGVALNHSRGRQAAMGDPAALGAKAEELEETLSRRQQEYEAISAAMTALQEANAQMQERFSPRLNRLAGEYFARLTDSAYTSLTLDRELEGSARRPGDVLPRSALYLSRGTADQLYLAVRLAVCGLCLPQNPPLVLDDALTAFDDRRLGLALELLEELGRERQILLFTCQNRERALLPHLPAISL